MGISFSSKLDSFKWSKTKTLRSWVVSLVSREIKKDSPKIRFHFVACGLEDFRELHDSFIHDPIDTDILTFQYAPLQADIFLCIPIIQSNSFDNNTSVSDELYRVMIHGVLHVLGYTDKTDAQQHSMRLAENRALQILPSL